MTTSEEPKYSQENTSSVSDKKAVALTYHEELNAPVVSAKGQGYIAEKILETAQDHGIETYFDEELLETLMTVAVGDEIPEELYTIVAKVLVFVEKVDKMKKEYR